jgi:hypothetical protein
MTTDELIDAITGLKIFHADPPAALTHYFVDKSGKTDWAKVEVFLHILSKYRRLAERYITLLRERGRRIGQVAAFLDSNTATTAWVFHPQKL